jgi:hypothetical protein
MANDIHFTDLRKLGQAIAYQIRVKQGADRRGFDIESREVIANTARLRTFEDQALVLIDVRCRFLYHMLS